MQETPHEYYSPVLYLGKEPIGRLNASPLIPDIYYPSAQSSTHAAHYNKYAARPAEDSAAKFGLPQLLMRAAPAVADSVL